jgi:hypothetical protein
MALIVQDPILTQGPSSPQAWRGPDYEAEADRGRLKLHGDQQLRRSSQLHPPRTLAAEILAGFRAGEWRSETSFELESHGGHARTVTGTVAYLDEQAQTFLVLTADAGMVRVPLRDITSIHGHALDDPDRLRPGRDAEGLGTGQDQPSGRTTQATSIR